MALNVTEQQTASRLIPWMLLLLIAGCTGSGGGTDEPTFSERLDALEPVAAVELATSPRETPAEAGRAADALWAIDACALVPDAVSDGGRTLDPWSPHSCSFAYEGRRPEVSVGAPIDEETRLRHEQTRVAGAKAYRIGGQSGDYHESAESCFLLVPVSPTHAISVEDSEGKQKTTCSLTRRVAAHAVRTIRAGGADGDARKPHEDTCTTLRTALGGRGDDLRLMNNDGDIDSCGAYSARYPHPDAQHTPSARAWLTVDYSRPEGPSQFRIGGRDIHRSVRPSFTTSRLQCTLEWRHDGAWVGVTTGSCAWSKKLAKRAIAVYDRPAATGATTVRFYEPGKPDRGGSGACAQYVSLWELPGRGVESFSRAGASPECRPAEKVDLPDDRAELLRDAEANPDVLCTLARPGVPEYLTAVTLAAAPREVTEVAPIRSRPCVFVNPSDGSQVLVFASTDQLPRSLARGSSSTGSKDPQRYVPDLDHDAMVAAASQELGDSAGDPGHLTVMVGPDPPFDPGTSERSALDPESASQAERMLDAIVNEQFEEEG